MIRDLGIVRPGTTLYIPFHTFDSNDPSASVTLTGLATTDIEVYKDGSVTQRASDSGYALLDTDGIDFDATTGIHGISIDLADNTTAGFWASGSQYWVVIASVTVDAATVNFILCTFRIGYPAAMFNTTIATLASQTSFTLTSGPAEDDALNNMWCVIHDVASAVQCGQAIISDYTGSTKTVTLAAGTTFTAAATDNIAIMGPMPMIPTVAGRTLDVSTTGEAGLDWANIGSPTTAQTLSGTSTKALEPTTAGRTLDVTATGEAGIDWANVGGQTTSVSLTNTTVSTVSTLTGHTAQTGDSYARLGAPAGASVSADIAAIQSDTNDIQTRLTTIIVSGTADSGSTTTLVDAARTEATTDHWRGCVLVITSGTNTGLGRLITGFTPGTDTITVSPAFPAAISTDTYEIWPGSDAILAQLTHTSAVIPTVTTLTGHTAQTGDSYARLGAPAGASVSADIAAVKVDTAATLVDTAEIGAAGAGLTAVPWNAAWDAEVQSEVDDALNTAIAELGVAAPSATPTLRTAVMLMYMALRNKLVVQTSGTDAIEIYNDAGTKIASKLITDDGSDYTEAEMS